MTFLGTKPELKTEYGSVIADQTEVYANDVEANADLSSALGWLQRSSILGYASGLYQFAVNRAKPRCVVPCSQAQPLALEPRIPVRPLFC